MMAYRTQTLRIAAVAGLLVTPLLAGTAMAQSATMPAVSGGGTAPQASSGMMGAPPVSHQAVTKAGQAMRNVLAINKTYGEKLQKTSDPAEKQQLVAMAKQKATSAITKQGLTVGEYNQVLASARQNPATRQQLLSAAGVTATN